jgi:hypothetical protein
MSKFSIEALPFYPSHMIHRMARPDEKVKNHLRNKCYQWLKYGSQFLGDNADEHRYVSLDRIATTKSFRAYEYHRIIRLLIELSIDEHIFELDVTKTKIRVASCHPNSLASNFFE